MKIVSLEGDSSMILREAKIHAGLDHPYIVKYLDSWVEGDSLIFVMELCGGGDLSKLIVNKTKLPESTVWKIALQICMGLEYLHSKHILHRDLKPANILLTSESTVKIADLGLARVIEASLAKTLLGTPFYLAPELITEQPYGEKSDIWALGCVIYELWMGQPPFVAANYGALILKILKAQPATMMTSTYSPELKQFIFSCLEKRVPARPTVPDILKKIGKKASPLKVFVPGNSSISQHKILHRQQSNERLQKVKRDPAVPYGKRVRNKFKHPPPKTSWAKTRTQAIVKQETADMAVETWYEGFDLAPEPSTDVDIPASDNEIQPDTPPSPPIEIEASQKIEELQQYQENLSYQISSRFSEISSVIGDLAFSELHSYVTTLLNSQDWMASEKEAREKTANLVGRSKSHILGEVYLLVWQEMELVNLHETICDAKFDLL